MTDLTPALAAQPPAVLHEVVPNGLKAWLRTPRSRYVFLQSLVGIALSYELLFGNETVVPRWVAEFAVAGLLVTILGITAMPKRVLETGWFVNGLVGFDTLITAGSVYLAGNAREDFYLSYFLLILTAASVRTLGQMLGLSAVVCVGYGVLVAEGLLTTGDLSAGQLMGLPVLLMMGVFYGLTLEDLGAERRRGEGLSHRLAALRLEEEHLLLMRDRLLHEIAQLKRTLADAKRGQAPARLETAAREDTSRQVRSSTAVSGPERQSLERLAGQLAVMLQDVVRLTGRETGALRTKMKRDDPLGKHVEQVLLAGERVATMAAQLQGLAQHDPVKRELYSLNAMVVELELTIREMLPSGVVMSLDLHPDGGCVEAAPGMVEQIVLQLAMNARDSMPTGGHLVLATRFRDDRCASGEPPSRAPQLIVRDTGCGMTVDTQARLLEPFFTTKSRGGAWGMGLTKVQTLVARLGGAISVTSQPGKGTEVVVTWPPCEPSSRPNAMVRIDPALCADGVETVLLVEEDECLRKWTLAALRRARYQVLEAQSGVEAMLLAQQYGGGIQLVVSAMVMPDMTGAELAERLFSQRPRLRAIFTSHYSEEDVRSHRIAPRYYLQKPYRLEDLLHTVREVLDAT